MTNIPALFSASDVKDKTVLLRVDLNVPVKDGAIYDANRLQAIIPTLKELLKHNAKIVLLSHRGRPKGKVDPKLSLGLIATPLRNILDHPVSFCDETIGDKAQQAIADMAPGSILLLENLRFHSGEEKNTAAFAKNLAALGNVYINDAFAVSHRKHASVVDITKHLPSFAGVLLQKEIQHLSSVFDKKSLPVMAIIGGSKISTKIGLLENLIKKVKTLAIGGGIANTFLMAKGYKIGNSLCEPDQVDTALRIMTKAKKEGCTLILPTDVQVSRDLSPNSEVNHVSVKDIQMSESIFDIGPKTTERIETAVEHCKTLIWNGPVGLFEHQPFDRSSLQLAQNIAHLSTNGRLISIAGGGETIAAIKRANAADHFTYLSTGGGAFLEYIEGHSLPRIKAFLA